MARIELSHKRGHNCWTWPNLSGLPGWTESTAVSEIKDPIFHIIPSKELFTYFRQKRKQGPQSSNKYLPPKSVSKATQAKLTTTWKANFCEIFYAFVFYRKAVLL